MELNSFEKTGRRSKCCSPCSRSCRGGGEGGRAGCWICLMLSFRVAHGGYKIGFQSPFCPPAKASSKLQVDPLRKITPYLTRNDLTNLPSKTFLPAICALIPWRGCWRFLSGIWRVSTLRRSSRREWGGRRGAHISRVLLFHGGTR